MQTSKITVWPIWWSNEEKNKYLLDVKNNKCIQPEFIGNQLILTFPETLNPLIPVSYTHLRAHET
jgi:hypothetical protein